MGLLHILDTESFVRYVSCKGILPFCCTMSFCFLHGILLKSMNVSHFNGEDGSGWSTQGEVREQPVFPPLSPLRRQVSPGVLAPGSADPTALGFPSSLWGGSVSSSPLGGQVLPLEGHVCQHLRHPSPLSTPPGCGLPSPRPDVPSCITRVVSPGAVSTRSRFPCQAPKALSHLTG